MSITRETIRIMRVTANLSGAVVCAKVGCARNTLSQIELGQRVADQEELGRIAAAIADLADAKVKIRQAAIKAGWPANEAIPA